MTTVKGALARSVRLRSVPTHREAREILARLGNDLEARGATVEARAGDALAFRMPLPWRAPRPTWLLAASAGDAIVTAGGGGPWRVRFALHFGRLRVLTLAATAALLATGLEWPRLALLNAIAMVWVLYFAIGAIATRTLARLVRAASADIAERRRSSRATPAAGSATGETGASGGDGGDGRGATGDGVAGAGAAGAGAHGAGMEGARAEHPAAGGPGSGSAGGSGGDDARRDPRHDPRRGPPPIG
jgi:hypothetical protein